TKKAENFVDAALNLKADIEGAITGQKLFPYDRTTTDVAQDVATVAAPVASVATPIGAASYAGGALLGATTRAAGGSEEAAQNVDVATNLLGGGLEAGLNIRNALRLGSISRATKQLATATPEEAGEVLQTGVPAAANRV